MCYPDCGCILTNVLLFRLSKRGFKTFRFLGLRAVISLNIFQLFVIKRVKNRKCKTFLQVCYFVESVLIVANSVDSVSNALHREII